MPRVGQVRLTGIDRYLAPSEHVLYSCRRHPVVIFPVLALWLLAVVVGSIVGFLTSPNSGISFIDNVAGWIVAGITLYSIWSLLQWAFARYTVTDQRVLLVEGLVSRGVSAIPLSKVTDTTYHRSIFGRLLGYGDFMLDSPGEKPGLSTLTSLPRPDEMYRLIMSLVVKKEEMALPAPPPPHVPQPRDEDETGPMEKVTAAEP